MHTITRLEQALRLWEDECLLGRYIIQGNRALGREPKPSLVAGEDALHRAPQLRAALRHFREGTSIWEQFRAPMELTGVLTLYPVSLAAWTADSRRAFELDPDLERLLLATSLEGVTWRQTPFPFGSFAILLPTPLEDAGGTEFDCILFSNLSDESLGKRVVRTIILLSCQLDRVPFFNRAKMARDAERGRWDRIQHEARQLAVFLRTYVPVSACVVSLESDDRPVTSSMVDQMRAAAQPFLAETGRPLPDDTRVLERYENVWNAAARLVVGLSFYLSTVEGQERGATSAWQPTPRTPDPNAITQDAQICCVRTTYVLTREERQELEGITRRGYQMSAHFRRGHWRRRPGEGADPHAPKAIWVRPCLVRGDRLPEGGVPGGGLTRTT